MKTFLISFLTASLLGLAVAASDRLFAAVDFIAIAFATGLVAWTFSQYHAPARTFRQARPIHLPIKNADTPVVLPSGQRAA